MFKISENLKNLAKLMFEHGHKLFVVGGYVRNNLLNIDINDVDIASSMPAQDVLILCKINGFGATVVNKKLGTILITKDDEQYEYTTFRKELYDDSGKHSPDEVEFVSSPNVDAERRDFTINAIYYCITENKIYDFFDGQKDLKKKQLKTVVSPELVFTDDGLRILRLIRFICELDFKPEKKTLKTAKEYAYKVKDISKERILKEIKLSVNGGLKYHLKNSTHGKIVKYYNKLNLWQYIFNSNFKNFKIKESGKLYNAFLKSDGSFRYIAFMCLVLNNYIKTNSSYQNVEFSVNQLLGVNGLKESNKNIQEVFYAYLFVQKLLYLKEDDFLDAHNCLEYEKLSFETKTYLSLINPNKLNNLKLRIMQLKKSKVPFQQEELNVENVDLIKIAHVKEEFISKIRATLFEMCVNGLIINDNYILLEQAKFLNDKLLKIFYKQKLEENTSNVTNKN